MSKFLHHDIMVSSTFKELEDHRDVVIAAILELGLFPQAMEFDAALPDDLINASLNKVRSAVAYVGIIGYRYGQTPVSADRNPKGLSITELEYEEARKLKLPVCMFVMSAEHLVPRSAVNSVTAEEQGRLEAFRKRVAKDSIYAEFDSVGDLKSKALLSLTVIRDRMAGPKAEKERPSGPKEVLAMPPYLAGTADFQGRKTELQKLSDWAAVGDKEPVLILEAIGGMGKSFLSWHWVTQQARSTRPDFAGIFWYSFYEHGGDMREFCAHALAYVSGKPVEELIQKKTPALANELLPLLRERPWLLILDGLERVLVAYNRYDASHMRDEEVDEKSRADGCIRPSDADFLQALTGAGPSKFLLSSRLMPGALLNKSGIEWPGVAHVKLRGLDPSDAEAVLQPAIVRGDSASIRRYLDRNFGCHPLVVGVVGGLVRNYAPAPGDFDTWVADPLGGAEPNLVEMDVVGKRNHIFKIAFDDLTPDARTLLARIGLVGAEVDYATLVELNPRRGSSEAEKWLRETLQDLVLRGLLQWDRAKGLYDLHPVVRGYAVNSVPVEQREGVAQRLIDYFNSLPHSPWDDVATFGELENSLRVVRANLHLGRFQVAASSLLDLGGALMFNLEAYEEYLALLRPVFSEGWERPASHLEGDELSRVWTCVAICIGSLGREREALRIYEKVLLLDVGLDRPGGVVADLSNIFVGHAELGQLYDAHRAWTLMEKVAPVTGDGDLEARTYLSGLPLATRRGDFETAEQCADGFAAWGPPNRRAMYLPGEFEFQLASLRFYKGSLDEATMGEAESLAEKGNNRQHIRALHWLRGEWQLSLGHWDEAVSAFEEEIRMMREVNLSTAESEARLAFARAKMGQTQVAREEAERLSELRTANLALSELYLATGDLEKARRYVRSAYEWAWGDGEPYANWWHLQRCREVLQALGEPEPQLPKFDPANFLPLPYEAKVLEYIERLRK